MGNDTGSAISGLGPKRRQPPPSGLNKARLEPGNRRFFSRQRQANLKGQVVVVGDFPLKLFNASSDMKHSGVVLRIKGDKFLVHLGPAYYFWEHDFPIKIGDILEVTGSRLSTAGHDGIIVAEKVCKQGKTLKIPLRF